MTGLLVALAVVAASWGRARRVPLAGRDEHAAGSRRRLSSSRRRRAGDDGGARLAGLLVEVAALLRAGAAPDDAWRHALGTPVLDRVPTADQLAIALGGPVGARRGTRGDGPPLGAVVAAARVADELGAPLAGVLEQVAAAIAAQAEAAAEVAAAMAAPRSSARVLAWLPLAGLLLGTVLGADPVGVLLGGGPGSAAGVAGVVLMVAGRRWAAMLLRRAARAGVGA